MITLPLLDILQFLLAAARWTVMLSIIAFIGGGTLGLCLLLLRFAYRWGARVVHYYVELFQGTPLLLQLFLVFFGLPLLGVEVSPLMAAGIALTFYSAAFLTEIWRGCVEAIPKGQWEASAAVGLDFVSQMRDVILPQALRIAIPPTVGFLVQLIKATALSSIVGFNELTRAGTILSNATFQPLIVYGVVASIYFAMCYPLTFSSRLLERKLRKAG